MDRQHEPLPYEIISSHVRHGQLTFKRRDAPPLKDWQTMPELPTSDELMASEMPILLPNDDQPMERNEYFETHYRLFRCEGTELLRQAITSCRHDPHSPKNDCHIYTQVHVTGYFFTKQGASCRVSFSTELSPTKVVWNESKRLTQGALVALTPASDNFRSICRVATVANRVLTGGLVPDIAQGENENTPPRIDLYWANSVDAIIDPSEEMIMVEASSGFFESVRFAMAGLQHTALHESRFDKYIVQPSNVDDDAEYVTGVQPYLPIAAQGFDYSQQEAFQRMTSKEMAIVQGPPGTGKTFTSVVALESLVRAFGQGSQPVPIIVAAQTNHALDQLLAECISDGHLVARIGGRCSSELVIERTLFNIRRGSKMQRSSNADKSRKYRLHRFEEFIKSCFPEGLISAASFVKEGIITEPQYESLKNEEWESVGEESQSSDEDDLVDKWLGQNIEKDMTYVYSPPQGQVDPTGIITEEEASAAFEDACEDECDLYLQHGVFLPIKLHWTGSMASRGKRWHAKAAQLLREEPDLYQIPPDQRGMVYRCMRQQLIEKMNRDIPQMLREYQMTCDDIKIHNWTNDVKIIKDERIQIVGCTTTGLCKYRGLIAALKPKVLMVEEAAEAKEASISAALLPTLNQIILVGDHQQLVPNVDVPGLGCDPYNLSVSLFERLVRRLPFAQLQVQRRMIPALREVVQTFYPNLSDHPIVGDVNHRPPVPGMRHNMWWFSHTWSEARMGTSYSNLQEAQMVVGMAQYLSQNGITPGQMNIITFYTGQVDQIVSLLKGDDWFQDHYPKWPWVKTVRTVDGFQGEQNEVILLSAVRSCLPSQRARAGFVENENRAVVALSRAKRGMFVFGNHENLLHSTDQSRATWEKVFSVFKRTNQSGPYLPVICKYHGKQTNIADPDDWFEVSDGGCTELCEQTCQRGHKCLHRCHPMIQSEMRCETKCDMILKCGHECTERCGETCRCSQACDEPKLKGPQARKLPLRQSRTGSTPEGRPTTGNRQGAAPPAAGWVPAVTAPSMDGGVPAGPRHLTSEELMKLHAQGQFGQSGTVGVDLQQGRGKEQTARAAATVDEKPMVVRETWRKTRITGNGRRIVEGSEHIMKGGEEWIDSSGEPEKKKEKEEREKPVPVDLLIDLDD